jgi:hypothetical protein
LKASQPDYQHTAKPKYVLLVIDRDKSGPSSLIWDMTGSIKLRDDPGDTVRVETARCERHGQMHDMCGVHYLGLTGG